MKKRTSDPRIAQKVLEVVAAHYKTKPEILSSEDGDRAQQQTVMFILKEGLGESLRSSREAVNAKSDPTVYAAIKAVKTRIKTDAPLAAMIEEAKAEALLIATMPGEATPSGPTQKPTDFKQQLGRGKRTKPAATTVHIPLEASDTSVTIGGVQRAVTSVFLGADLLQNADPGTQVMLAKDAVVFLVWDDFPKIPRAEMLSALHLDQDGLYRAIGRISVCLKEKGNGLKKKLKAARAAY